MVMELGWVFEVGEGITWALGGCVNSMYYEGILGCACRRRRSKLDICDLSCRPLVAGYEGRI